MAPGAQRQQLVLQSEHNERHGDRERASQPPSSVQSPGFWERAHGAPLAPRHTPFYFGDQPQKTPFSYKIVKPETGLLLSDSILEPFIKRVKARYTLNDHFLLGLFRKLQWWSLARPWA